LATALPLLLVAATVAWAVGELSPKSELAACISQTGSEGECQDGRALRIPMAAAMSPDGKNIYVASQDSNAVAIFDRDLATGVLHQKSDTAGCVSKDGSEGPGSRTGGACQQGRALSQASDVAVSPDGANVYVVSTFPGAIAVFDRDSATGVLRQQSGAAGCVSDNGSKGACQRARALVRPAAVVVSPDGKNVYVASEESNAVAIFVRDPTTGALSQAPGSAGCISETPAGERCRKGRALEFADGLLISPDGKNVYVSALNSLAILDRDPDTGALIQKSGFLGCVSKDGRDGCRGGRSLKAPGGIAVSPDGRNIYRTSDISNAVTSFDRDVKTGELTSRHQNDGCIAEIGARYGCRDGRALRDPLAVTVSPDGRSVYVGSFGSDAVAIFSRNPTSGSLTQIPGRSGCVGEYITKGCQKKGEIGLPEEIVISPDGKDVYVVNSGISTLSVFDRRAPTGKLVPG
jgi:DNA-binding beta-propeller fold protein YncE